MDTAEFPSIALYERVMQQVWEDRQEAERAKVEREAPALVALGLPPEEFVPVEWPGTTLPTFADMIREWEAPVVARIEHKRDQFAEAFDGLIHATYPDYRLEWAL
ncbi:hypothetical protein NE857_31530 [Nocardiopsis exhalans]|uniref:Uncharacterized protein n=1 Tax=Nocardiopsis exhalans TaxID=163604 RepID=A0ABY5D5Q7_9ACTN|nr:hypothetical protein [Nocardiopsis exhalans]USY19711.1 hypothetical protein NE857_31530 [Nocardiopsis exhalans]